MLPVASCAAGAARERRAESGARRPGAAQCSRRERSPWPWPVWWLVVSRRAVELAWDRSGGGTHPGVKGSPGELSPSPSPPRAEPPEWPIQAAASRTGSGTVGLGAPWSPCRRAKPRQREPRGSEPRAPWPQRVPLLLCFWKRRFGGFFSAPHSTLVPRPMASRCPPGSPHPAPGGTSLIREGNPSPVIRLARVRAWPGAGALRPGKACLARPRLSRCLERPRAEACGRTLPTTLQGSKEGGSSAAMPLHRR